MRIALPPSPATKGCDGSGFLGTFATSIRSVGASHLEQHHWNQQPRRTEQAKWTNYGRGHEPVCRLGIRHVSGDNFDLDTVSGFLGFGSGCLGFGGVLDRSTA
ncbi:hypothetical protein [Mesorhizobium sp. M0130]|uniref:hypothetical protein n=1 Tax=Mesorhizobium sp. M0130 TaxID=2956887 RepID=UPI003334E360